MGILLIVGHKKQPIAFSEEGSIQKKSTKEMKSFRWIKTKKEKGIAKMRIMLIAVLLKAFLLGTVQANFVSKMYNCDASRWYKVSSCTLYCGVSFQKNSGLWFCLSCTNRPFADFIRKYSWPAWQ